MPRTFLDLVEATVRPDELSFELGLAVEFLQILSPALAYHELVRGAEVLLALLVELFEGGALAGVGLEAAVDDVGDGERVF